MIRPMRHRREKDLFIGISFKNILLSSFEDWFVISGSWCGFPAAGKSLSDPAGLPSAKGMLT